MASRRFYAYYIRGKQLALVEYDNVSGSGQTLGQPSLDDIGPSGALSWKSPVASIEDGIELEYAYSPRYILPPTNFSTTTSIRNFYSYIGWTAVDGYLTFLTGGNQIYSYFDLNVDDHIVIQGSNRWNGLHKIQEVQKFSGVGGDASSHGGLKTYTKVNQSIKTYYENSVIWVTNKSISDISTTSGLKSLFQSGLPDDSDTGGAGEHSPDYPSDIQTSFLYISGSDATYSNNGLFTNWKMTSTSVLDLSEATRYMIASGTDLDVISTTTFSFTADTGNQIYIYEAFLDPGFIYGEVDILNDETDTIDLPEYLAKALVYYVKAKVAEDMMDLEQKAYYTKEFQRIIEKHESSKIWGARQMISGPHSIR